jgi:hypothetical protein
MNRRYFDMLDSSQPNSKKTMTINNENQIYKMQNQSSNHTITQSHSHTLSHKVQLGHQPRNVLLDSVS